MKTKSITSIFVLILLVILSGCNKSSRSGRNEKKYISTNADFIGSLSREMRSKLDCESIEEIDVDKLKFDYRIYG